jgi:hypothetical protein
MKLFASRVDLRMEAETWMVKRRRTSVAGWCGMQEMMADSTEARTGEIAHRTRRMVLASFPVLLIIRESLDVTMYCRR